MNYNGPGGGDLSDWAGSNADAYDATIGASGVNSSVSAVDISTLDVIGWDVPEPSAAVLSAAGLAALLCGWRRGKQAHAGK